MKTKTKTKLKKKPEDYLGFELEGQVYIVERKNGKKTRTAFDGKLVLQCLVEILSQSVDLISKDMK